MVRNAEFVLYSFKNRELQLQPGDFDRCWEETVSALKEFRDQIIKYRKMSIIIYRNM